MNGVFAAVDVHYAEPTGARAALVTARDPQFARLTGTTTVLVAEAEPYRAGELYLRELPAIRAVCQGAGPLGLLVIDGYVDLDPPAGRASVRTRTPSSRCP